MWRRQRGAETVSLESDERIPEARVVRVASFADGELRVHCQPGAPAVPARVSTSLDDAALAEAAREGQDALVLFEEGDAARPIVVALLRSRTPLVDALVAAPEAAGGAEAVVDGRRVVLEGKDEIVLRCGRASLTLRSDGSVVLRGVNVVSQAQHVHKIRGGKVQIN